MQVNNFVLTSLLNNKNMSTLIEKIKTAFTDAYKAKNLELRIGLLWN